MMSVHGHILVLRLEERFNYDPREKRVRKCAPKKVDHCVIQASDIQIGESIIDFVR